MASVLTKKDCSLGEKCRQEKIRKCRSSYDLLTPLPFDSSQKRARAWSPVRFDGGSKPSPVVAPSEPVEPKKDTWSKYSINVPWRMVKARSSYDIGPPTTIPLAVVAPMKNSGFATADHEASVSLTQSNRLDMPDTSYSKKLKPSLGDPVTSIEDGVKRSASSLDVKEATDILSKAIKKRGKYATPVNCARSVNFLSGIFDKGKKQPIAEQNDLQQKCMPEIADAPHSNQSPTKQETVEILPQNAENINKQKESLIEYAENGVSAKSFQKMTPMTPENRGRTSQTRTSSRAASSRVSDVVSRESSIPGRPTSFRQSFPSGSKEGKPKFENWFREVQEASKFPVREKPVWVREKTSPLHSHIQKTRSFYDEMSSLPARQLGRPSSLEARKSQDHVADKQAGNACPKEPAPSERNRNSSGFIQHQNHHVSCSDIPSLPHLSLPSTAKNPVHRVSSMITVAPRTPSLNSVVSPVMSFVPSPHVAPTISSPPCSPRRIGGGLSSPIPSASVSTEVTLRLPFHTPFAHVKTVDVFGSVVIPAHKVEGGEASSLSSSSSSSTPSSETERQDSAHGGQERSAPVGGLMDEGGFVNSVPSSRPLHFTSPIDVIESARKARSLPGFYKSPTSPPQSFREAFAYAYQCHPPPIPCAETVQDDSKEPPVPEKPPDKKSRRILGGIFRRRKKGSSSSVSDSSESESDAPKKTFFTRRIKKRESQSRKKEKDNDEGESKVTKLPVKDNLNLPVTSQPYGRQTTYLITTDTGKVIKMSPTGSLGREVSKPYNFDVQPLGIPKTPLSRTGVSASHDSLPESAYGSINSSLQSSRLGRSSSTDTISRKEKKEALKTRVERLRERIKGSSSEDDDLASGSSVFGSGTSLNRSDSFHIHRSRSSRTERYLRRKSQELEILKVESEKDRRNREVVQARILEIQKSQRGKPKRKPPAENFDHQVQLYEKPKWSKHFMGKDAWDIDPLPSRGCPKYSGNQYIVKKISDATCWPRNSCDSRVPPAAPVKLFSNINPNQRSVSYENHINKVASCPSPYKKLHCSNSFSLTPPAPPPRDRSSLVSPYECHRPISYSFENLNQESYSRRTLQPPRIDTSVSPLPPKLRDSSQHLPPASPYRRSSSERHLDQKEYSSLPIRPTLPKAYSPSKSSEVHLNSLPTTASSFPQVYYQGSSSLIQPYGKASTGKTLCIPNVAPSPSSDYSSYVSDSSIKIPHPPHFNSTDGLQSSTVILETTVPNTKNMKLGDGFRIGKEVSRTISLPLPDSAPTSLSVKSDRADESDSSSQGSNRDPSLKQQNRPLSVVVEKSESGEKESPPLTAGQKPQPPKRSSSSVTTYNRELLKQQLDLGKNNDDNKTVDIDQKFREFFLKEKERLEKSKCANFEEALIELETIYKSLNLNSDDIFDGAEERESSQGLERDQRDRSATPKPKKPKSPDRTLDDLHYRRVQSSNRNQPDGKNALQLTGSYLLISPSLGPPPLDSSVPVTQSIDPSIGKEPDIVYDDVTVKNAQLANLVKIIDPQPPFGIPLGPVTQGSRSDYMNAPVPRSISRQESHSKREPDTVTDDLAFRALRKDGSEVNKPVDFNVADLEALLEDSRRQANVSRSKSVPRSLMSSHSYAATPQKKMETQTPRRLKHNHKTKRYGGSFCESFKEALTDGESSSLPNTWRQNRSWVERANLSEGKWDNLDASTETLKAASQPDIRMSLISESRFPPGKAGEEQNLDKIPFEPIIPTEPNQTPVSNSALKPYFSAISSVKGTYKPFDSGFNASPKPFYLNQGTEVSDSKKDHVDLVNLDSLISSISESKSDHQNKEFGEPGFLMVKEAKENIQNAILGSVSNNKEIVEDRRSPISKAQKGPTKIATVSPPQNESEKRRRRLEYERQRLLNQEKKRSPEAEEKEKRKLFSGRRDQPTQQRRSNTLTPTSEANAIKKEPVKKQPLKKLSLTPSQPHSRRTPPRKVVRDEPTANHNGHLHHKPETISTVKSVEKELESEHLSSSSAFEMVQERRGSFPDKMSPLKPIRTPMVSGDEKAEQEKRDRIQRYKEERRKQMAARYGTNDVSSSDEENTHSSSVGGLYKRRRRPRSGLGPTSDAQTADAKRLQASSVEHLKKSRENIASESLSQVRSEHTSARESLEQSFTSTSTTGTSNNNEVHAVKDEGQFSYNQELTSEPSAQRKSPQEGGRVDSADSTLSGSEGRVGGRRRTSGDEKDKSHKRKSHLNRASTSEEAVYPPGGGPISQLSDSNEEIPRRRRRRTPQGASDSSYNSSPNNTTPDATARLTPSALAPSDLPGFSVTKGALPPVTPFSSYRNSQGSVSSTLNSRFKESDSALFQESSTKTLQQAKGTPQKTTPLKLGPLRKPEIPDVLRHRESNPALGSPGVASAKISRPSSVVIEKPPLGLESNSSSRSTALRSSVKKSGDASLCFMASRRERKDEEAFPRNGVRSDSPENVREHLDSLTCQAQDLKSRAETLTGDSVFQECEEYLHVNKGFSVSRSPSSPPPERRRSEESDESLTDVFSPLNDTGVISDSGQKNRPGGPEGSCEGFGRMVLEEKVREGPSSSALSSGPPHPVDNAVIGRKNSLIYRREEDGVERASQGILKRVSLDLQDGDPRPILKKKSSVDDESLSDPKKSILKKKSLTDDELDSDRPRSILKSARSREDLMDRNDSIPSPPTPILKRGSKDHSEMEGGELRPILKRRDTTDGVKGFVGNTLVRRDSAPLPTLHPSHGILKKRPSSPSLEFGITVGERPLSVAERVAGMEAMQSESPVGGAKPKIRSRPSSRERPSSPSLLDREARRNSWVSPPPTPVGHLAFVEPDGLRPQSSDSFGTPPLIFGQTASSRVSQKAAFFAQLEHEKSSAVSSPISSPIKKDRGTRFATQPVTEGEVNKATQMFESPSGRRSPRELQRSPEAGKSFSTIQGSESVVMRRMSGDPVLILPRRLSAQELRYEDGHGQEHVRGILKSDPGREKHKENPKSILKVDSRKSSFSEGEQHPRGILKSESPMSSNKGSPEHEARSLKSVLKKDSSSEESKEIKSILKPESQSFDPEISSDSSSDVTTQDLSSSFSAGDTIVQAVNPFLVDSYSSCGLPLGSPVPSSSSVEVEFVARRSSSVNQQVMEEAVKQALPMKTKDNLAEALRQIEPIRDKSREREKEDHKTFNKEDVLSNIREKGVKKSEEWKEKKEDRSRPLSKVVERKTQSKKEAKVEEDTEIAQMKASFEENMKSLSGLGQDFRSYSKEVTFRHRTTQQKVATHQDRWTVNDFSSCTKMESPPLRNSSLESPPSSANSSSPVGLTKFPHAETVTDAAPASPVTPVGSSINARLQSLQKHGEEGWKNRVQKDDDVILSPQLSRTKARPASLMERVSLLETSSEQWRDRVTQSDATKFTVAHKMASASSVPSLTHSGERRTASSSIAISSSSTSIAISETLVPSPASERKKRSPQPKVFKSKTGSCLPELLSKSTSQSSSLFEAKRGSKDFSRSISIPSEGSKEPDADENSSTVVSIPRPDDEHFDSFFASSSSKDVYHSNDVQFDTADFDVISSCSSKLTVQRREVRLTRKNQAKRNPLRTLAQRADIKDEYTEFSLGVGERELRRMKVQELSKNSSLAMEALAGLASKENFSSVALKKVEDSPVQRELAPYTELMLIHIKGRRHPQVRLVAPVCKSVNQGDDFLLVTPFELFHYKGRYSNVIERAVASEMALYILQTKDLGVTSALKVTDVEEGSAAGKRERFWKKLGGTVNTEGVPAGLPDADDHIEAALIASNKIYEVKDQALVPSEEAWGQSPKYELLSSEKVLVFDFGSELYLWSGKRAPLVEKKKGTALLKELWKEKYDYSDCDVNPIYPPVDLGHLSDVTGLRPSWCICAKITENVETILFKEKFLDWPDTAQQHRIREVRVEEEQKSEPVCELEPCDVEAMINTSPEEPDLVLEMSHLGRGVTYYDEEERRMLNISTNDIKVWHISENEKNELDRTSASQFFSGEAYVVRWYYHVTATGRTLKGTPSRHNVTGRSRVAYFFWQGSHSSLSDKGVSALMTVELDEERGPHVRVSMGFESPAFLNLFKGTLVVFKGKRENMEDVSSRKLFLVRGEHPSEASLLEIEFSPAHLRSRSCVVVVTPDAVYLWIGSKAPNHTKEVGQIAANHLCEVLRKHPPLDVKEELEGYESRQLCESFGRDTRLSRHYFSVSKDMSSSYDWTTRVWKLDARSGTFEATEFLSSYRAVDRICPFPIWQDELYDAPQPALFLVDAGCKIYIWQGWIPEESPEEEVVSSVTGSTFLRFTFARRAALQTAITFATKKEQLIKSKKFKNGTFSISECAFILSPKLVIAGMESLEFQNLFPFWRPREDVTRIQEKEGRWKNGEELCAIDTLRQLTKERYTLEELQEGTLPDGVDPSRLEKYLSDEDFKSTLGVSKREFLALPAWKQLELKKKGNLF